MGIFGIFAFCLLFYNKSSLDINKLDTNAFFLVKNRKNSWRIKEPIKF